MLFRTARWVASDATFPARLMIMSARDARDPEEHEGPTPSGVPPEVGEK